MENIAAVNSLDFPTCHSLPQSTSHMNHRAVLALQERRRRYPPSPRIQCPHNDVVVGFSFLAHHVAPDFYHNALHLTSPRISTWSGVDACPRHSNRWWAMPATFAPLNPPPPLLRHRCQLLGLCSNHVDETCDQQPSTPRRATLP